MREKLFKYSSGLVAVCTNTDNNIEVEAPNVDSREGCYLAEAKLEEKLGEEGVSVKNGDKIHHAKCVLSLMPNGFAVIVMKRTTFINNQCH